MSDILKPTLGSQPNLEHILMPDAGYWLFNEGSGNIVSDLSGNGRFGNFVNSPIWVPGQYGSAIDFVIADTDYINLGDFTLAGETQITIIASVKGTWGATDLHAICAKYGSAGTDRQFYLAIFQRDVRLFVSNNTSNLLNEQGDTNLADDVQYQIAGVWRGGTDSEVYINGVRDSSTASGTGTPTVLQTIVAVENVLIAARDDGVSGKTTAVIDYVMIYNRALTASEIAELYLNPFIMFEQTPLELWVGATSVGVPAVGQPTMRRWSNIPHMSYLGRRSA